MWEYRAIWPSKKPEWWDGVWKTGERILKERKEEAEARPDTYLALPERPDVGLKLRNDTDFEVKVLHSRQGDWELWEKIPYFKWNPLEVTRLANMLRIDLKSAATTESVPLKGAEEFLRQLGMASEKVQVRKTRIQTDAGHLLKEMPRCSAAPWWLSEIVEIRLPGRESPVYSVCLETVEPLRGGIVPLSDPGAIRCGYPELLARHLRGSL